MVDKDRQDLQGYLRGDRQAAKQLIARYSSPLLNHAIYMLGGDQESAKDLVQDCFMRLWTQAEKLLQSDQPLYLRAWLFRVLRNLALDQLRKPRMMSGDEMPELVDHSLSAQQNLEFEGRAREAWHLISRLPERQKSALLMAHFEDMSNPEIGTALDCSVEAVENLLARARRSLRKWAEDAQLKEVQYGKA